MIYNRVLILGASGFIGNAIYKELRPYFDVYGTYCTQEGLYGENQAFFRFDATSDDISSLLNSLKPGIIISSFTAPLEASIQIHNDISDYCQEHPLSRLLFFSSDTVFDAQLKFPSHESDKMMSVSAEGRNKISHEKLIQEFLPAQHAILRLPIVLGTNAPQVIQLRQTIKHHASFEVYPNRIVTATTDDKVAQQTHYIINKELRGTFHLASKDLTHHDDLFYEIASKLSDQKPVFTNVYIQNDDYYQCILPKENLLPEEYHIEISDVIDSCTLKDEIITLKQ